MKHRLAAAALGLLVTASVIGCYSTPNQTPAPPARSAPAAASPNAISIKGFAFSPSTLTVAVGTTVTWTNEDSAGHTVTGAVIKSNNLSRDDSFSYTFTQPGTYEYKCAYHPGMTGKVIVTP
jgi:plastocyanin